MRQKTKIFNRAYPTYFVMGLIGYILGAILGIFLTFYAGLNIAILLTISVTAAATCLGLVWLYKVFTGWERLIYYHHEIAILMTTAGVLILVGEPIWPYLDIVLLGIGMVDCLGRWGCLSAGCCYGKPCSGSICVTYGQEQIRAGFPGYYKNVKLFPLQIIESLGVFLVILIGVLFIIKRYPAGTVLVWYTISYGLLRYCLEFFRGDAERPYWGYFSEAQWTTIGLMCISLFFCYMSWLPFYWLHFYCAVGVVTITGTISILCYFQRIPRYKLFAPRYIQEIYKSLNGINSKTILNDTQKSIPVLETSVGLAISKGVVSHNGKRFHLITISSTEKSRKLTKEVAHFVAKQICIIMKRQQAYQIRCGRMGVYHIIV